MNRPYSLNDARLASGAFYETAGLSIPYEIIKGVSLSKNE
jgi:hypothetical protein